MRIEYGYIKHFAHTFWMTFRQRQTYDRQMKIQCFRQVCAGQTHRQTDRVTPWAP